MAFKGFTTITNSGGEMVSPERNVARAIAISIVVCTATYLLVAWAVARGLTFEQIVEARDYALARAAEPTLGPWGRWRWWLPPRVCWRACSRCRGC